MALSKPLVRTLSAPALADLDDLLMGPSAPPLPSQREFQIPLHPIPPPRGVPQAPPSPKKHLLMDPSELRAFGMPLPSLAISVYYTIQPRMYGQSAA